METEREREKKKGARGGEAIRACHLHILDIRVWDERVGAEMKKQNECIYSSPYCMWAILCNFAFISTEREREKKKKHSKAATQRKLNPTGKHYFETW